MSDPPALSNRNHSGAAQALPLPRCSAKAEHSPGVSHTGTAAPADVSSLPSRGGLWSRHEAVWRCHRAVAHCQLLSSPACGNLPPCPHAQGRIFQVLWPQLRAFHPQTTKGSGFLQSPGQAHGAQQGSAPQMAGRQRGHALPAQAWRVKPDLQHQFLEALPPTTARGQDNETELGEEAIVEARRPRSSVMRGTSSGSKVTRLPGG